MPAQSLQRLPRSRVTRGFLDKDSIECVLLRFFHAGETSIATGLVAPAVLAAGHSVDSGVGPRWLASTGARGRHVYTSGLIYYQVSADKAVGVAVGSVDVGQCDLCGGR